MSRPVPVQRVRCACGGRYSVRVVIEYKMPGQDRVDSTGGRFCYINDALIDLAIPVGATPVQCVIYDFHEAGEVIRITFSGIPVTHPAFIP